MLSPFWKLFSVYREFYGLYPKPEEDLPLSGAARLANSHKSGLVLAGSMISSTKNASAVLKGERTLFNLSVISSSSCSGFSEFFNSAL